jgi:DNA helicase IV
MQWRVLVRRCPMRSFTIVGDIAQVSSPAGATSWAAALQPYFKDSWRLEELTVNYRTPAQIAQEAERMAQSAGLPITPTRSVREGDWPIRRVSADGDTLPDAVVAAVEHDRGIDTQGTLAVIAPVREVEAVAAAITARYGEHAGRGAAGLNRPIAVLSGYEAKGLEFDAVVLADPGALAAETARGAATLYVAMTRPTQRLTLVAR